MKISPLAPAIGGRIDDCDLTQSLNSSQVEQIQDAFLAHAVLLFPDQSLTHQDQLRAAQIFGESGTLHRPREFQPKAYDSRCCRCGRCCHCCRRCRRCPRCRCCRCCYCCCYCCFVIAVVNYCCYCCCCCVVVLLQRNQNCNGGIKASRFRR